MRGRLRFAILVAIVGLVTLGGNVFVAAAGQSNLAEIRQVTARFHDIEVA